MVWDEAVRIMSDLFDVWGPEHEISVGHATSITLPVGHIVFSVTRLS